MKRLDLVGQKFNMLTVIAFHSINKKKNTMWLCKCDCGNEKVVCGLNLRSGQKSCGCLLHRTWKRKKLEGLRFGKLTVLEFHSIDKSGLTKWKCKCDCGNETIVYYTNIRRGHTTSCGCHLKTKAITHGYLVDRNPRTEYGIWSMMKQRCYNTGHKQYYGYGGRGIRVCDRWLNSAENFINDMGIRPSMNHSLDRINNDGDYCPENCRWVTRSVQQRNTRANRWVECNGRLMVMKDAISELQNRGLTLRQQLERINQKYKTA